MVGYSLNLQAFIFDHGTVTGKIVPISIRPMHPLIYGHSTGCVEIVRDALFDNPFVRGHSAGAMQIIPGPIYLALNPVAGNHDSIGVEVVVIIINFLPAGLHGSIISQIIPMIINLLPPG